ncbi:MAG: hypothetical protein JST47_04715 [Bacteroidetes bacterium]|nr:hypothetical protein [Bacteroidota bacterium]MBS1975551.1 hypothetical protein [Bacteroidota bacterium]
MKTNNLFRIALLAAGLTLVFACQKENSASSGPTSSTDVQTAADDQAMVSNQNDAISDDATAALNANASISGASFDAPVKSGAVSLGGNIALGSMCGATITYDTANGNRIVTIVYNGDDCVGRFTKTGKIVVTMAQGTHWKDAGAVVNISVDTLTITRKKDGKSIVINGSKTITNTSGGLLADLATTDSIVHDFTANWTITYQNGSSRTWTSTKHRVFTYNNGVVVTTTGSETGVNRFGVSFSLTITQPKVIAQSCDFSLVAGQDSITRSDNITSVITYGLDANGNVQSSCPLPNGYYYAKLVWANGNNGKQYTFIFPY